MASYKSSPNGWAYKYICMFVCFICSLCAYAQQDNVTTTFTPTKHSNPSNNQSGALAAVEMSPYYTFVTIEIRPTKNLKRLNFWTGPSAYVLMGGKKYPCLGVVVDNDVKPCLYENNWGWDDVKKNQNYYYTLAFAGRAPEGITDFSLIDQSSGAHGYSFNGYTINNPKIGKYNVFSNRMEFENQLKPVIIQNNDPVCGIYEQIGGAGYRLGVIKNTGNNYIVVYLDDNQHLDWWHTGDYKAFMEPSATPGAFKVNWIMADKKPNADCFISFDGTTMSVYINGSEDKYLKMFPNANTSVAGNNSSVSQPHQDTSNNIWTGTGWALMNNYIATNFHVVDGAKSIQIYGVNGDFTNSHSATVVASDKFNDLAILRLNSGVINSSFIPYSVDTNTAEVGEEVYVLGYPMTSSMGEEIKLTTGVISSRTGFQGDVSIYQISAPIQPGNSGGPLFDSKGNVIGIVSAKHQGAENVGYAIKASYLKNLMESALTDNILPNTNRYDINTLSGRVKASKPFVYYIKCSDSENSSFTPNATSKTYLNPYVTKADAINPILKSVELQDNQTILTFSYTNGVGHEPVAWVTMDSKAYIVVNGQKYFLTKANGIAISPDCTYFTTATQSLTYQLIFPPIPSNTKEMDFVESSDSDWNLYGIKLQ